MNAHIRFLLSLAGGALAATGLQAAEPPKPTPQQLEFFEKNIRPILADNCYKCHSAKEGKTKGGLTLDSRDGWMKGGDSGPAIVPGDLDKSLVIKAVRYTDESLQMPPKGEKLPPDKVSLLEQWVKMGAPDPRDGSAAATTVRDIALKHWAFQPVKKPAAPDVKDKSWVKTPIDAFVLAKLEAKGIAPSKRADQRTLIRRATVDLIGLPPTMEEFDDFMKDRSPGAYEKLVDRLLKSPHYGERWGRHWLDVARYADTKGDVDNNREDFRYPYAWTYRDYVIQAYNDDKPFDRFILEQLAADKLPDRKGNDSLAALGFLTVGKRFNNDNNEIIDDRIDVVTKGFLGLTVTCARCHDHKFDPIPTKDYYSLHGIFNSIYEPRREEELPVLAMPPKTADYQQYTNELAKLEMELENFQDKIVGELLQAARTNAAKYLYVNWELSQPTNTINRFIFVANNRRLDNGIYGRWENAVRNAQRKHDPVLGPWVEFAKLSPADFPTKGKELAARFSASKDEKQPVNRWVAQALLGSPPASMAELSLRYDQLFKKADAMWRDNVSRPKPADALADKDWEQIRQLLYGKGGPSNPSRDEVLRMQGQRIQGEQQRIRSRMVALHLNHPGSPARAMVVADSANPRNTRVYIRGNGRNLGDEAPRRFLEALSEGEPQPFKIGSGRLELAQAIASKDNPLTARVYVNRVWMHLFGEGLVRSPSDLGTRAEAPSHPELLDWLAAWFMDNGWSTKKLIRLIMTSNTYQQVSDDNPRFAQMDPGNYLLWRQNVRRAEFEVLRDSVLAIGGKLDLTMGGPPINLTAEPFPTRRTVYGLVDRRNLASVFTTFDFANPDLTTGQRYTTTVPQQALFLMNNPLVVEQSRNLVQRPDFASLKSDDERIRLLYRLIYQRQPTEAETRLAATYLGAEAGAASSFVGPIWQYGYGEYDARTKRVHGFAPMGFFSRERGVWMPKENLDAAFGYLSLTATGGHPGPSIKTAAIRRWTSPVDGTVEVDGTLGHTDKRGDGIVGLIVSSRLGEVGRYVVANKQLPTKLPRIPVAKGETIDFVVLCLQNPNFDTFTWSPQLKLHTTASTTAGVDGKTQWNARNDFSGPSATEQRPMDAWERYAQVLLLTNELTFIN